MYTVSLDVVQSTILVLRCDSHHGELLGGAVSWMEADEASTSFDGAVLATARQPVHHGNLEKSYKVLAPSAQASMLFSACSRSPT